MKARLAVGMVLVMLCMGAFAEGHADPVKHVIVYKEPGMFGGWPANHGIWSWDNEIVVGFLEGFFKKKIGGHAIDDAKPSVSRFARSLDGGETWQIEVPDFLDEAGRERPSTDCPGGIDFTHPDFAMTLRMVSSQRGFSHFYYSMDRCKTWHGPYNLPTFDRKGIAARTDYIVLDKHDLMAFLTASKENGAEGRVFCTRTRDGGKTWDFVSWIGPEPEGYSIMPSTVRLRGVTHADHLGPTTLFTAVRCRQGRAYWLDTYLSEDSGATWRFVNRPTEGNGGNPASMIQLADGRLAITYGYRLRPYGIRARLSSDNGQTWGDEIVLRDDGGNWDLGYPRTVQRPDGKLLTVYYFNDHPLRERYIAATIWTPPDTTAQ